MKQSLFVFRGYKAVLAICVYFDRTGPYCFTTVVSSLGWYPFWVRNTCQKYKIRSNKVKKTKECSLQYPGESSKRAWLTQALLIIPQRTLIDPDQLIS